MKDNIDIDRGCGPTLRRTDGPSLRDMQLLVAVWSSVFLGFRFSPTDYELINYYLKKKLQGSDNCVDIIPEVDFCRHEPWDLPEDMHEERLHAVEVLGDSFIFSQ